MPSFAVIAAMDGLTRAIGRQGKMAFQLPPDMQFFRRITMAPTAKDDPHDFTDALSPAPKHSQPYTDADGVTHVNAVIMGRKTFESLDGRTLKHRFNIVLSRNPAFAVDAHAQVAIARSLDDALRNLARCNGSDEKVRICHIFVIGGEQLYREALQSPYCRRIYLTEVILPVVFPCEPECDTFFPDIDPATFQCTSCTNWRVFEEHRYRFQQFDRCLRHRRNILPLAPFINSDTPVIDERLSHSPPQTPHHHHHRHATMSEPSEFIIMCQMMLEASEKLTAAIDRQSDILEHNGNMIGNGLSQLVKSQLLPTTEGVTATVADADANTDIATATATATAMCHPQMSEQMSKSQPASAPVSSSTSRRLRHPQMQAHWPCSDCPY